MSKETTLNDALRVLKQTSRTFYIPITLLNPTLKRTVASAYLCMRAIDEMEDHETLPSSTKQHLLFSTSQLLEKDDFDIPAFKQLVEPYHDQLPEVSLRLHDWLTICPNEIVQKVKKSTSEMAVGMAKWVEKNWQIKTKEDLDEYTYYVAGLVGVMLSDIWEWYDGTKTDRKLAIGFGRGLQAVNILRNQEEDATRGVQFFPEGWTRNDMFQYAKKNLNMATQYLQSIKSKNILIFCKIPLALAHKTLDALKNGKEKMTRAEVESTVKEILVDY